MSDLNLQEFEGGAKRSVDREMKEQDTKKNNVRKARKEQSAVWVAGERRAVKEEAKGPSTGKIALFESEVQPFDFAQLDSGHFILYRSVWRDNTRYTQGGIIEAEPFLLSTVKEAFEESVLPGMSNVLVAYGESVIAEYRGDRRTYFSRGRSPPRGDFTPPALVCTF